MGPEDDVLAGRAADDNEIGWGDDLEDESPDNPLLRDRPPHWE
jgi:hypothetical protein